jgi:DNA-binding MarR family transcriptional regulator
MPQAAKSLSSAVHLLHRASQRADALFTRHVPGADLTPRQFAVMQAVARKNGLSQTDIMAVTGIDRSSTAELVRRLVSNGCLQRRRTRRDARLYAVRITAAGRQLLAVGVPAARTAEEQLLLPLPSSERSTFLRALTLITAAPFKLE